MTLGELLTKLGMSKNDVEGLPYLDYELRPHQAGEQGDEVVSAEVVHEVHAIYLEYE